MADVLPQSGNRSAPSGDPALDRRVNKFWRVPPTIMPANTRRTAPLDFKLGVTDKRLFPFEVWRRLSARALRAFAGRASRYAAPQGQGALREAIAKLASFGRAVACQAADVVVR